MAELGRQPLTELVERLKPYAGKLVAEKLATQADHEFCVDAGCDLFQGYFFCRPAVACTRGIAANRLALLQVAAVLNDPAVQLARVEQLIAHDVALSFRLLRYVNSAVLRPARRCPVDRPGARAARPRERQALVDAERAGEHRRQADRAHGHRADPRPLLRAGRRGARNRRPGAELFTLGLFSVLDAMMDAPMIDVVASLPLAAEMRDALVSRKGKRGLLLQCVTALETGEINDLPSVVDGAGRPVPRSDDVG